MATITTNNGITLYNVAIDNSDSVISGNLVKSSINVDDIQMLLNNYTQEDLINTVSSINAFSINWNKAALSYITNTYINTSADLLSILDSTYITSYTLVNQYNDLLQKYNELLDKYNGK